MWILLSHRCLQSEGYDPDINMILNSAYQGRYWSSGPGSLGACNGGGTRQICWWLLVDALEPLGTSVGRYVARYDFVLAPGYMCVGHITQADKISQEMLHL